MYLRMCPDGVEAGVDDGVVVDGLVGGVFSLLFLLQNKKKETDKSMQGSSRIVKMFHQFQKKDQEKHAKE